jgi:hypothetical protein
VFQFFQKYAASVLSRVAKVDLSVAHVAETHLQQPPDVAAGPACMRVGVERVPRCRHGTRSVRGRETRSGAAVRPPCEAGVGVRTLAPSERPGARRSEFENKTQLVLGEVKKINLL